MERTGVLQVSSRIKLFLVAKLWCHHTSHQLVWLNIRTNHGFPSVGTACFWSECTTEVVDHNMDQHVAKSSFRGHKPIRLYLYLHCALYPQKGFYSFCVWCQLIRFILYRIPNSPITNKRIRFHTLNKWKDKSGRHNPEIFPTWAWLSFSAEKPL